MIVVSDTSPLNYLVLIHAVHVLPKLFERVIVPHAVMDELQSSAAPDYVRAWVASTQSWLEIRHVTTRLPSTTGLHVGEAEAISVAASSTSRLS